MSAAPSVISLKSSVFFSRFDEGVVFRGSEAPVVFRGKRAYDLVGAVLDRMERGTSREQLISALPDAVQPVAGRLIGELQRNALLREREADDPHAELDLAPRFANLWSYLADRHTRPGEALTRWRTAHFVISGDAEAASYAVRAIAECAAERVSLIGRAAASGPTLDAIRAEFPGLDVALCPDADIPPASGDEIAVYAGGDHPFAPDDTSARNTWYFGLLAGHLGVAFVAGALASVVPAWEARMRSPLQGWELGRLSGQRVALAAAATAFGAFNRHAGLGGMADWSSPHIVEPSSQITRLRLPDEVTIGGGAVEPVSDQDGTAFDEAVRPLLDPVTGIFEEAADDLPQVPLSAFALRVFAHDRSDLGFVVGWGLSHAEARRRAVARGLVAYLRSEPEIGGRASSIAVAAAPDEAVADAVAALVAASAAPAALPLSAVTRPDAVKLAKLFGLVTGHVPALTGWAAEDGAAACVEVHLDGRRLARASGAELQDAAYVALGDACLAVQLPEASELAAENWAAPDAHDVPGAIGAIVHPGFTTLAGHLFCAVTGVATR
jgi:hypothetical protein